MFSRHSPSSSAPLHSLLDSNSTSDFVSSALHAASLAHDEQQPVGLAAVGALHSTHVVAYAPLDPVEHPHYNPVRERMRQNPWVLVLAGATGAILIGGLISFKQGNKVRSQQFMRARVVAQGATITLMLYSLAQMRNQAIEAQNEQQQQQQQEQSIQSQ